MQSDNTRTQTTNDGRDLFSFPQADLLEDFGQLFLAFHPFSRWYWSHYVMHTSLAHSDTCLPCKRVNGHHAVTNQDQSADIQLIIACSSIRYATSLDCTFERASHTKSSSATTNSPRQNTHQQQQQQQASINSTLNPTQSTAERAAYSPTIAASIYQPKNYSCIPQHGTITPIQFIIRQICILEVVPCTSCLHGLYLHTSRLVQPRYSILCPFNQMLALTGLPYPRCLRTPGPGSSLACSGIKEKNASHIREGFTHPCHSDSSINSCRVHQPWDPPC